MSGLVLLCFCLGGEVVNLEVVTEGDEVRVLVRLGLGTLLRAKSILVLSLYELTLLSAPNVPKLGELVGW